MSLLDQIIGKFSFDEFTKAIRSIDTDKIVDLLEGWGKKYFKGRWKSYLDEVRKLLADIVYKIGGRMK
jgi:hypothetical protein